MFQAKLFIAFETRISNDAGDMPVASCARHFYIMVVMRSATASCFHHAAAAVPLSPRRITPLCKPPHVYIPPTPRGASAGAFLTRHTCRVFLRLQNPNHSKYLSPRAGCFPSPHPAIDSALLSATLHRAFALAEFVLHVVRQGFSSAAVRQGPRL